MEFMHLTNPSISIWDITIHILPIRKNLFFCFLSCWRSFGLCNRKNNSYKSNIFYTHPSDVKIRTNNRGKTFLMQLWKITRVLFSTLCQGCFHYIMSAIWISQNDVKFGGFVYFGITVFVYDRRVTVSVP